MNREAASSGGAVAIFEHLESRQLLSALLDEAAVRIDVPAPHASKASPVAAKSHSPGAIAPKKLKSKKAAQKSGNKSQLARRKDAAVKASARQTIARAVKLPKALTDRFQGAVKPLLPAATEIANTPTPLPKLHALPPHFEALPQEMPRPIVRPMPVWNDSNSDGPLSQLATEDDLKQWVIDSAVRQYAGWFDKPAGPIWPAPYELCDGYWRGREGVLTTTGLATPAQSASFSQTNTQEAGVDEADLVETDGTYIYSVSGRDVVITAAMPAADMRVVSRHTIDGPISGMYLHDGRLAVVSSPGVMLRGAPAPMLRMTADMAGFGPRWQQRAQVTILDVSDPAQSHVLERIELDGRLITSRAIDGRLYLALGDALDAPTPNTVSAAADAAQAAIASASDSGGAVYESEQSYRQRLVETWKTLLPQYSIDQQPSVAMVSAPGVYVHDADGYANLTSVLLVDMSDAVPAPKSTATIEADAQTAYASTSGLYLLGQRWNGESQTDIYKLDLGADQVSLVARGSVKGAVLNQFSMDEQGGDFRIATSTWGSLNSQENAIFVLRQDGSELKVIGSLGGLAMGEQIYSVRFTENTAYVVTFRQVDPFWVIDMSDPQAPKIAGELQIPGFSKYLQPIGDHYVMGTGQAPGADSGFHQLQVSLFDVSDPANPQRVGQITFGNGGVDDPFWGFDYDHHAINYFADAGIIALPLRKGGSERAGLELLKVGDDGSLSEAGYIEQDGGAIRSVLIDTTLFSVGRKVIQAQDLATPQTLISSVVVGSGDDSGYWSPIWGGGGGVIVQPTPMPVFLGPPVMIDDAGPG